jgi:5-formyltetrahydrofolate cyclo-ligase family
MLRCSKRIAGPALRWIKVTMQGMNEPFKFSLEPSQDKKSLRRQLQAERQALVDRHQRSVHLQQVLRVWLVTRRETSIGAYWPIKGEFDALPALYRWSEADPARRIGLPVVDRETKHLRFHVWYPGCAMEEDAYGIPKPKDTEARVVCAWVMAVVFTTARSPTCSRGPSRRASAMPTVSSPG